jgi:hypothetical protein
MLPAADLAEIIRNLATLQLAPNTTAAVLGAVLAPPLRKGIFVCAALAASIVSVSAQTKTPIGTWWSHEIQGLEHYYTSHAVCGYPLTDEDRKVIVEAFAKINQFSIEDAQAALNKSTQRINEDDPDWAKKLLCGQARDARLKAISAIRSPGRAQ